jgi:hypothetical protein
VVAGHDLLGKVVAVLVGVSADTLKIMGDAQHRLRVKSSTSMNTLSAASPSLICFCAKMHAAAIAKRSVPMSARRPSSTWRFSSFGPNFTIWWNSVRASRRLRERGIAKGSRREALSGRAHDARQLRLDDLRGFLRDHAALIHARGARPAFPHFNFHASSDKLRQFTGFAPKYSLPEMLQVYYDWWTRRGDFEPKVYAREQAALRRLLPSNTGRWAATTWSGLSS